MSSIDRWDYTAKLQKRADRGFTIVELLIVIVVIAILSVIVIVAYNGIQKQAKESSAKSAVSQASKKIRAYAIENADNFPNTLSTAGVQSGNGTTFGYEQGTSPKRYCATAYVDDIMYFMTNVTSSPVVGDCTGMTAWWTFNGDARDSSGRQVDGTVNGATLTTGHGGRANGAYALGATSQYINVGSPTSFTTLPSAFTYSVWVARTGTSTTQWPIIMGATDTHRDFGIRTSNFGTSVYFEWGLSPYAGATWGSTSTIISLNTLNEWHHVAVTLYSGTLRTYADGVQVSSQSATLNPTMAPFSFTTATSGWAGNIDDARVYSRPLSQQEIQALYNAGAQ